MIHVCPLFVLSITTILKVLLSNKKRERNERVTNGKNDKLSPFTGFLYLKDHKGPIDLISTK